MKLLVIANDYYPFDKPTAKLTHKILSNFSNRKVSIDVVSKGTNLPVKQINDRITNYQVEDFDLITGNSFKKTIYKINRKIFSKVNIWGLFDKKRLFKKADKIAKVNRYDAVLSIAGVFSSHDAATRISNKYNIPLFLYYTDPFTGSWVLKKKNQKFIHKIENKWLDAATNVFMPECYLEEYKKLFPDYLSKIVICELPGFFNEDEINIINKEQVEDKLIVYTGDFFPGFREPDNFIKLAKILSDYKFLVLGSLRLSDFHLEEIPSNIFVSKRKSGLDFLKTIGSASFLYLEDNSFPNQIPFKSFEYISTGKPIIYSTKNIESATSNLIRHSANAILITDFSQIDNSIFNAKTTLKSLPNNLPDYFIKFKTEVVCDILFNYIKKAAEEFE